MKKLIQAVAAAAVFVALSGHAMADEKVLGTVTKIDLAAQEPIAVATLKDSSTGQTVDITVADKVTLDKFKDKRITVGDEIKAKYEKKNGKNLATFFKKPGGCS